MIINEIKEIVALDCQKAENVFGTAFFDQHLIIVSDCACRLAELLGADREIVKIASYLHDISAVRDISTLSRHALISAEIAAGMLKDKSYNQKKIEAVQGAILSHSSPIAIGKGSLEEVCLSNADAVSQIVNPKYWMFFAFSVMKMGFDQGVEWYRRKIDSNWAGLISQARDMIEVQYKESKAFIK